MAMKYPDFDFDVGNLEFSHSPLLNELHKLEIATDARLDAILDLNTGRNLTRKFIQDLEWRATHKHNVLINLRGVRGCGKSTFAQGIKGFNDELREQAGTIKEIVFSRKEYMECYKGAKPGELFIIDEDFGFQTQTGSFRIHESMMLAEQTFRIEEVSTIACSVAHSSPHLYDFDFLVYDYDAENGVNRAILFYSSQLNGGMFSRPAGYVLFPSKQFINRKLENHYLIKKKEFSTAVKLGKARTLQQDYDEIADAMIKKFHWDKLEKKPTIDAYNVCLRREYPQMANTEMSDIVQTLKFKMWEIFGSAKEKSKKDDDDK
jgi:energy-coupling factor transporter ATP-binding protein EcfA2